MKRLALPFAVAAMSACATRPRDAVLDSYPHDVIGRTSVMYYDIHGRTIAELHADMRRQGPKLADSSFVAETLSPMRWEWHVQAEGTSACAIHDPRVYVNAQILLPRWTPPADTEPGVFAEWNRFIAALETHEAGHKNISAKAGSDIVKQVSALSGSCSAIGTRANDIARIVIERANIEQQQYDAETHHGLTQGTSFGIRRPGVISATMGPTVVDAQGRTFLAPRLGTIRAPLAVPMERAWRALLPAFAAAGLAVTTADSALHIVSYRGNTHEKIGDSPLSAFFDCGAVAPDVALVVQAQLTSTPTGDAVITVVTNATVRSSAGTATACRSNSTLEGQILQAVRAELAR